MTKSSRQHEYEVRVEWTGNRGSGTSGYKAYDRDHVISAGTKRPIEGSADPEFFGNPARWNPEDLLVASVSACHKLWYLHLSVAAGMTVTSYVDAALGQMTEEASGGGHFTGIELRPVVTIAPGGDATVATALHDDARRMCFVANSMNFPVTCRPETRVLDGE